MPHWTERKARIRFKKLYTRRAFVGRSAAGLAGVAMASGFPGAGEACGAGEAGLDPSAFDREMARFMEARKVPGGALAVVKEGRLVYSKGYGMADREKGIAATPRTLFRIASISKPITGIAVMKLAEEGRLDLDAKAFGLLGIEPTANARGRTDARLARISVRQLLHHTGGWDRGRSFDPMFRPDRIAAALGVGRPPDARAVIRYMLGKPLDFDPGTRYAYSNFGYCVLGRIVEKITGRNYGEYVGEAVLKPMGVARMRLGRSLEGGRAPDEARYYMAEGAKSTVPSVFPEVRGEVPWPYGGFCLEAMDAHGGWIASAEDLVRVAAALDVPARSPVLKPESIRRLYQPPAPPVARTKGKLNPWFYGLGWMVRPKGAGKANYWHGGSLPGTHSLLVRRWDGLSWAVLFNQRSADKKLPDGAIDAALHRAADATFGRKG